MNEIKLQRRPRLLSVVHGLAPGKQTMFKTSMTIALAFSIFATGIARAALKPATYEASYGSLKISSITPDSFKFHIESFSNMGDTCEIDVGQANKTAEDEFEFKDKQGCVIQFNFSKADSVGIVASDSCHYYCGVSAGFGDRYQIRPKKCSQYNIQSGRKMFKREYAAHKYRKAFDFLREIVKSCKQFITTDDLANMRSDLAIAAFHDGDKRRCMEQIQLARSENANLKPENLANLPNSPVYDHLKAVSKALSFNEKKCSQK